MKKGQNKDLTKAEEQVMQILWDINKGFVKDIIAKIDEPKPAYNTTSTIVRILETKGFVGHTSYGKSHQYYPLISKDEYTERSLSSLMSGYFDSSYKNLVSFFTHSDKVSVEELKAMKEMIDNELNNQKEGQL